MGNSATASDFDPEVMLSRLRRLRANLPLYAAECLKIRTKESKIEPLVFNENQWFVHRKLEEQKARTGVVRALIGKGRQTTISTYIAARFYHRTSMRFGVRTFILTHDQSGTDSLFEMVERFHENNPARPKTGASNAKELYFDKLDSGYQVGVAATKATGRSQTIQLLHWSETAWSANARGHKAGVVQTVPYLPNTEIIEETTGNGPTGEFYEDWGLASRGIGDYQAIFISWLKASEYRRAFEPGFTPDEEERRYMALYGADLEQIAWRRAKIIELKDPKLFRQEYPADPSEMFQFTGGVTYIDPERVIEARKAVRDGIGPLIVGVDPARFGDDRFSVAWRRGRKVFKVESREKCGTTEALAWLRDIIDQDKPTKMFIDAGGGGDRLYDILVSWGKPWSDAVVLVNFGGAPQTEVIVQRDGTRHAGPANRRSEMWFRSKEWLEQEGGADIPDQDSIQADACAPGYTYRTTDQRLLIESKEKLRERGVRSPDEWDAIILTFAEPVRDTAPVVDKPVTPTPIPSGPSLSWMGL